MSTIIETPMEQLIVYFGVDPGWKNGGFTVCVDGNPKNLIAYNLNDTAEFLEHLREYKGFDRRIILEEIPFYVGKNIPSSTGVKLGFSCWVNRRYTLGENIPLHKVKPKKWQAGFSGLKERVEPNEKEYYAATPPGSTLTYPQHCEQATQF